MTLNDHVTLNNRMTVQTRTHGDARPAVGQALVAAVTGTAILIALVVLYAIVLDQGTLLSPVMGKVASTANYLHELAHDGRHLLGAPCH